VLSHRQGHDARADSPLKGRMTTYHVIQDRDGKWQVKSEGAERAWRIHDNRETAVNEALTLARALGRGQVLVHDWVEGAR
jgi:hypothetical protein